MAISSFYLAFAIIVAFLSMSTISASRPCKTFVISSYSLSITPENSNLKSDFTPTRFTIRRLNPHNVIHGFLSSSVEKPQIQRSNQLYFLFISENTNSLSKRTAYLLNVVAALFFSVGCGLLAGAVMYLYWILFVNRHVKEDDYKNDESDNASLKKLGYFKIPAPT